MKDKPSDEFRAFDDAMRSILSVSYRDVQNKLREEKASKERQKKRRVNAAPSRASLGRKKRVA